MSYKYLYIDDEQEEYVEQYVNALEEHSDLQVTRMEPIEFSDLIETIISQQFDGLLIDWKLDERPLGEKRFKAGPVAQELRIKSVENQNIAIPIVLISTDDKLKETFIPDETSHDLFDHIYLKGNVIENGETTAQELINLSISYVSLREFLSEQKQLYEILGLEDDSILDPRIGDKFSNTKKQIKPIHEYARYIINELLKVPGPLISEKIVAARLGVSIEKSKDWANFKSTYLSKFKYSGPFSQIWERWWSTKLENWWNDKISNKEVLQLLGAEERVALITKKTNLNLISADPIEKDYSSEYWTVCQDLERPLDQVDGFMIKSTKNHAWQEEFYISKKSASERTFKVKGMTIHPMDKERYLDYITDED